MIYLLLFCLLLESPVLAKEITVTVDGEELSGNIFVENGVTYTALAPLLDAIGGWKTQWDGSRRTAHAETDLFTLTAPIGAWHMTADGYTYHMNAPTLLLDGRTYVPLRSAASLLGCQVTFTDWQTPITVTTDRAWSYTEDDFYWLSRVISAESRGEDLLGQIAVGNVVLNRVLSPTFPNSIYAVIFDKKDAVQFEPVSNGTIYDPPTPQSQLAARLALNGASAVGDCMYFYNPSLSQGTWIRQNRTYYTTIGCHRFYR